MVLQGVLHYSGKLEESIAAGELALAMSGRLSWSMAMLAVTFAKVGKPEYADAVYTEMQARARRQYLPPAQLALAAAAASREDEAIHHTRKAFEIHDPSCLVFFSRHLPYSAPLYAYPRFREIIASMGRQHWL